MSIALPTSPAAGWYPDPAGEAAYRWWDGGTWTVATHPGSAPAAGPAPTAGPAPEPEPRLIDPQPVGIEQRPARVLRRPARTTTRWSSLLAAFPVAYPIAVAMVAALAYAGGAASSIPTVVTIAASAAVLLLIPAYVLAEQDRRELIARGIPNPPSLGWLLVFPTVGYLIARSRAISLARR